MKLINKFEDSLTYLPFVIISGLCLLVSFLGEYLVPFFADGSKSLAMIYFAWVSILISGVPLLITAIKRIMVGWISSPLLISIAMIAAIYIGDIFAGGEVAFIMAIGAWIEEKTVDKAKKGVKSLLNLVPSTARRITFTAGSSCNEEEVKAEDLEIGDIIRVLPGESFPADGEIISGVTSVDQSIMTGESLPIDKGVGDEVFSGTINCFGSVDVRVKKAYLDSSLQKMIHLVKDAETKKAPTEKLADKWARWLVPVALLIAIGAYFITSAMFGHDEALIRAVTVLVVFCPCALVLATPTSVVAAIGQATKYGVLIKSGEALENMGKIKTIALDKTGTITKGELSVCQINSYMKDEEELLSLAASIESRSEHPLAKSLVRYAKENSISTSEVDNFLMSIGKGVQGEINGKNIFCGNLKLFTENVNYKLSEEVKNQIDTFGGEGKAVIIVFDKSSVLGLIAMCDTIKDNSVSAIKALHSAGISKTILLTGDNERAANYVSNLVGIDEVKSSLLPEDKVNYVKSLMEDGNEIAMVGDGVNDAPALKLATVGISMGCMGSDIAIEASDIALMGDDIEKISYIKKLSDAMVHSIKFNIILSLCINVVTVTLSVLGLLVPTTAALAHNVGSIFVVLNAGRLYGKKF